MLIMLKLHMCIFLFVLHEYEVHSKSLSSNKTAHAKDAHINAKNEDTVKKLISPIVDLPKYDNAYSPISLNLDTHTQISGFTIETQEYKLLFRNLYVTEYNEVSAYNKNEYKFVCSFEDSFQQTDVPTQRNRIQVAGDVRVSRAGQSDCDVMFSVVLYDGVVTRTFRRNTYPKVDWALNYSDLKVTIKGEKHARVYIYNSLEKLISHVETHIILHLETSLNASNAEYTHIPSHTLNCFHNVTEHPASPITDPNGTFTIETVENTTWEYVNLGIGPTKLSGLLNFTALSLIIADSNTSGERSLKAETGVLLGECDWFHHYRESNEIKHSTLPFSVDSAQFNISALFANDKLVLHYVNVNIAPVISTSESGKTDEHKFVYAVIMGLLKQVIVQSLKKSIISLFPTSF